MMLSSAEIKTFFLITLLLAVRFLAGSELDSSNTSTSASEVSAVFFPCNPLPLLFWEELSKWNIVDPNRIDLA
ncbi:hypothetical protein Tco_0986488 [Tanacetum coccineum]